MPLPTIVLVPGAWHSPEYYYRVICLLNDKGYPTETVTLPSVGSTASMFDDAEAIARVTSPLVEAGKQVVLVMHSYSGIPGAESARGLAWKARQAEARPGGIVALVYLCAYLFKEGMSISGLADGAEWPSFLRVEDGMVHYEQSTAIENLYNGFPVNEDVKEWVAKLRPQSVESFMGEVSYAAHRDIASTYLLCENDKSIPVELQRGFVSFAEGEITTRTCLAGHSPMVSVPSEVADTIIMAATKFLGE